MGTTRTRVEVPRASVASEHYRSTASNRTRGASTRCTETSGSGLRTAGTISTLRTPGTVRLELTAIVAATWSAAVLGSTIHGASAQPTGTGTSPTGGAPTSA